MRNTLIFSWVHWTYKSDQKCFVWTVKRTVEMVLFDIYLLLCIIIIIL